MQAILSADQNWGIGKDGGLLVRVSEDMKFFRETTRGHAVVMGRKTFESLPGALPGRRNIVLSRGGFCAPGVETAVDVAALFALLGGQKEDAFVIGGGEIYRLLLPYTDRILVTRWDAVLEADTFFPNLDASGEFFLAEQSPRQESGGLGFTFCEYRRKQN
ncbi:dihydrofolate reductase [Christensenellaceae bacterium 44-20]|jgi:dihydrofolate reductase